ncbi:MAG: HAMP domain-containing histidine kinase [Clostridium sp.]|nr:HAMP domain-containing histidine kinase [Clostridium sp.]
MKKLKKSAVAKFIACILMSVSVLFAAVSTFFLLTMFGTYGEKMFDTEAMKIAIRDEEIERIAYDKVNEIAYSYYRAVVNGDQHMIDLYKERYAEDNSNLAFLVVPVTPEQSGSPVLSNYELSEFQYSDTVEVDFDTYPETKEFVFAVGKDDTGKYLREPIVRYVEDMSYMYNNDLTAASDHYYDDESWEATTMESVPDHRIITETYDVTKEYCNMAHEYYKYFYNIENYNGWNVDWNEVDGQATVHLSDSGLDEEGNYVVANGIHAYLDDDGNWNYLDRDIMFCKKYNNFFKLADEQYRTWDAIEWYDPMANTYHVELTGQADRTLNVTTYVKTSFTAHDDFYYSVILRHGDIILDYIYVIFGVSVVLTLLLGAFLVAAAGYGKKSDEPYASEFNRVPYDIILFAVASIAIGFMLINPYSNNYTLNEILLIVWLALAFPVLLLITCGRIKTKTLVSSMACVKLIKLLWSKAIKPFGRWLKKLGGHIGRVIRLLWNSIGIYGKYLGVFLAVGLAEIIPCFLDSPGIVFIVLFLEKLIFGAILIVACINLSRLKKAGNEIAKGNMDFEVDTKGMLGEFKAHGENLNSIRNGMANAVEESLKSERMKTELITNVSHDIKTPLTSIINYVDLLEKEQLDNEKAGEYIEVLDRQSARLKKLIQDLIDASKASTGNLDVNLEKTDVNVVINQAFGEFQDKLTARNIKTIIKSDKEEYFAIADGRHLWRVMENLINNIVKYALEGSRVYIDVKEQDEYISVTFKNISKEELNISGDELMERFVRGDSSRNTEGSGLGLSIARSLMELQKGKMEIIVDGDLFKVVLLLIVG